MRDFATALVKVGDANTDATRSRRRDQASSIVKLVRVLTFTDRSCADYGFDLRRCVGYMSVTLAWWSSTRRVTDRLPCCSAL